MQRKILVATANQQEAEQIEEILTEFLEKGGELLWAKKRDEALRLLKESKPQILFLDNALVGKSDEWLVGNTQIILIRNIEDNAMHGEDFVDRPLKKEQVMAKCHATFESLTVARLPPM